MACLKVLVGCALFFAGSLGDSWYTVLEALQNADFVLVMMWVKLVRGVVNEIGSVVEVLFLGVEAYPSGVPSKHPLLTDLDVETMQMAIQRLFDSSKNLEDPAFRDFVNALCKLSGEMVNMQSDAGISIVPVRTSESGDDTGSSLSVTSENVAQRRRISGIHIPKTLVRVSPSSMYVADDSNLRGLVILVSLNWVAWPYSTFIVSYIDRQMLPGIRQRVIF